MGRCCTKACADAVVLGEIRDRSFEQQRYRASGFNLATAVIVLWNTVYLERAAHRLRGNGHAVDDALLQYLSPLDSACHAHGELQLEFGRHGIDPLDPDLVGPAIPEVVCPGERDAVAERLGQRPHAYRQSPSHALRAAEHAELLRVANEPHFVDLPTARIVPLLAGEGRYSP